MRRPERRGRRARRAPFALRSRLPFSQSLGASMLARNQSQLPESRVQMARACDESSRAAREEGQKRIALRQAERGTTTSCEGGGAQARTSHLLAATNSRQVLTGTARSRCEGARSLPPKSVEPGERGRQFVEQEPKRRGTHSRTPRTRATCRASPCRPDRRRRGSRRAAAGSTTPWRPSLRAYVERQCADLELGRKRERTHPPRTA